MLINIASLRADETKRVLIGAEENLKTVLAQLRAEGNPEHQPLVNDIVEQLNLLELMTLKVVDSVPMFSNRVNDALAVLDGTNKTAGSC